MNVPLLFQQKGNLLTFVCRIHFPFLREEAEFTRSFHVIPQLDLMQYVNTGEVSSADDPNCKRRVSTSRRPISTITRSILRD